MEIFEAISELPPSEQTKFLEQSCADDPDLREGVEALLRMDGEPGLLDRPLQELVSPLFPHQEASGLGPVAMVGRRVGAYRILGVLGQGGMGTVYLAERADGSFERQVALKVVRGGLGTRSLEARFLRERRILARLEHPNIARLFDAGLTEEGAPFLVMERVEGSPITDYVGEMKFDVDGRVRLFLHVVEAVRHAHRNLVVHRDLKPSHVLVTRDGQVKLLDFGIARLLEDEYGEGGTATRTGMMLLTPEYAAPEQVRGEPITTATDVYALGGILYEILCGERPRNLEGENWARIAEALGRDDIRPPSEHLSANAQRSRVRGDLDTITLKALRSDPKTRYPSANALGEDLTHFLEGLPITARPASAGYRLRKFAQRHKVSVTGGLLVAVALIAGVAGTLWQARAASLEARRADAVAGFLFSLFGAANPEENRGEVPDARELLDLGAALVDSLPLDGNEDLRVELLLTLASLYGKLGLYQPQDTLFTRAEEESRAAFGDMDPRTAAALTGRGIALMEEGHFTEADSVLQLAYDVRRARGAPDSLLSETVGAQATVAAALGQVERALALHREALALDTRSEGEDGLRVATDLNNIGGQLIEAEDFQGAEVALTRALEIRRRKLGEYHPEVAITLGLLGQLNAALGNRPGAERFHREALDVQRHVYPDGHPDVARSLDQLAISVEAQGRYAEAERLYQEALALRKSLLGPNHPDVASTLNNMAVLRYRTGRYAEAARSMEEALDAWRAAFGAHHVNVAAGLNNLGTMRRELGDYSGAEAALLEALRLRRELRGDRHTDVGATLANLGGLWRLEGRHREAESSYREALSVFEEDLPSNHPRIADACWGLGATLLDAGRPTQALPYLDRAVAIREGAMVESDPRVAEARLWRAMAWGRMGRVTEAREAIAQAQTALAVALGEDAPATRLASLELQRLGG